MSSQRGLFFPLKINSFMKENKGFSDQSYLFWWFKAKHKELV